MTTHRRRRFTNLGVRLSLALLSAALSLCLASVTGPPALSPTPVSADSACSPDTLNALASALAAATFAQKYYDALPSTDTVSDQFTGLQQQMETVYDQYLQAITNDDVMVDGELMGAYQALKMAGVSQASSGTAGSPAAQVGSYVPPGSVTELNQQIKRWLGYMDALMGESQDILTTMPMASGALGQALTSVNSTITSWQQYCG